MLAIQIRPNLVRSVLSGLCFAAWPMFVQKSGMSGFASACFISVMCTLGAVPFALSETGVMALTKGFVTTAAAIAVTVAIAIVVMKANGTQFQAVAAGLGLANVNWPVALVAGVIGAAGMLFFNAMLATSTQTEVGVNALITVVAQVSSLSLYFLIKDGTYNRVKIIGLLMAVCAILLINNED